MEAYELSQYNLRNSFSLDELDNYYIQNAASADSFIAFCQKQLDESTMKKHSKKAYQTTINKLTDYQKDVRFCDLDYSFASGFHRYLRKNVPNPNTAAAHHRRVKKFIREAIVHDRMKTDDNPYIKFRKYVGEKIEPRRVFINAEELKRLESLTFDDTNKYLERAKDMFLLQTYTGLRHSDIYKIAVDDISYSDTKGASLTVIAQKTSKKIDIPLRSLFKKEGSVKSRPELILEKYLPHRPDWTKLKLQPYNRYLKEIAKLAKINKPIASHSARRGFVTILHEKGVPINILRKMLQHSKLDMTQIYIQLSNKDIETKLDDIEWNG
ncbi:MAG: site-specific integrase [Pseudomonadota bacterium]